MKISELVKDGWPTLAAGYSGQEQWMKGWNQCLAAIEPIKEMEVGLNDTELKGVLARVYCEPKHSHKELDANLLISIACALAANLGKILVVEKGK